MSSGRQLLRILAGRVSDLLSMQVSEQLRRIAEACRVCVGPQHCKLTQRHLHCMPCCLAVQVSLWELAMPLFCTDSKQGAVDLHIAVFMVSPCAVLL